MTSCWLKTMMGYIKCALGQIVFCCSWGWELIVVVDKGGLRGQSGFVCGALVSCLQVSFIEQSLMLPGRKIWTLFILVLVTQKSCWSPPLLLIRRGTFLHNHCLNGCQGGIKWKFINKALTGLSLTMVRGCLCAGICAWASPFMAE